MCVPYYHVCVNAGRKVLLVAVLAIVAAFCVFGFMATFEPLPWATRWAWRGVYSVVGLLSVTAAAWVSWSRRWCACGRVGRLATRDTDDRFRDGS